MAIMSIEEAMNVLELARGFSNDELKKAYRKKAMFYHPDKKNDLTVEKMQQINDAYEILNKFRGLKKGVPIDNSSQINHEEPLDINTLLYRFQILLNLRNQFTNLDKLNDHELYSSINVAKVTIQALINKYEPLINSCRSKIRLSEIANEIDYAVRGILKDIENDFLNIYPYFKEIPFNVRYDLTIYSFVKQLDQVKDMTIKKLFISIRAKCEEKFSLYVGYDVVKEKFDDMINTCVIDILKKPNKKDAHIIDLFEKIEIAFENAFDLQRREQELKTLIDFVKGMDSVILIQRVDKLKENIESEDFYDELDYLMGEAKAIKNKTYINKIRIYLIEQATTMLKNTTDISKTTEILDLLKLSVELLAKEVDGFLNYDILSYLYGVKFEDLEIDRKVLDFINNKSNIPNTGYVYVAKNTISTIRNFAYLYPDDDGYVLKYRGVFGPTTNKAQKYSDIAENFISLSIFLSNATFIGKRARLTAGAGVSLLYEYEGSYIVLGERDSIYIVTDKDIWYKTDDKVDEKLVQYKDKKLVLDKISERISKDINDKDRKKSYPR